MRVLVCGGRDFTDERLAFWVLDRLHAEHGFSLVIHGAARGADYLADVWARIRKLPVEPYPADWNRLGRAAGPLRNAHMLAEGRPEFAIAFPGGDGTADMVRRLRFNRIKVIAFP